MGSTLISDTGNTVVGTQTESESRPMNEQEELTDSEIAELRANRRERDHWKWLRSMLKRSVLWIVAVVAGVHALIEKIGDFVKWLQPK